MMTKRFISLLLAVMMIVAVIPAGIISISAEDTTYTDVEFTSVSWLCETDPNKPTSTYPMATEDGKNFYYQAPRGDEKSSSNNEIGSSDEGIITSVDDYIFADGFKFTFDANVCRAGCASWGVTLFSISFGTAVNFKVDIDTGYNLTVNGKTYTKNPKVACTNSWEYTPTNEAEANKINGTYTVEYMDGKVTVKFNGDAIDFGQDILIDAEDFATGKINITKGWSWTKVAKDSYDPADYATDFLIFSDVTLSLPGDHIHTYGEYVSNNDATCTANGTKTATCTVEGCGQTDTVIIPNSALGHNFVSDKNGTTKTCSECGVSTLTNGTFTADSWIIADGSGNTSNPTVSTADGTTFITSEFQSANEGADANEPAIITSKAKYDLSNGFVFSFDADLCRQNTNTWAGDGTNTTTISFGDAVTLEINGTGYSLIVDGTRHKLKINSGDFGQSPYYAPSSSEQVARLNTNYIVEFKDGKVSLYVGALVDDTNTTGLALSEIEVTGDLSAATIRIFRGWGLCADTSTYASLKNLDLDITAAPTPIAPIFEGVQEGTVGDVFSVRFVGTVKDLNYSEIGFKITAMDGAKSWTKGTNVVYSKLIGNTDTGVAEYTEENLDGQYIYALTIQGVPTEGTVTFNVTTYGIVDGVELEGEKYIVTYTDGVFAQIEKDSTVVLPPDAV